MIEELYIKSPQDSNYKPGVYSHQDPIESIISKIRMILGTVQGQVLGDLNIGVGIEELIFETRVNKFDVEERITKQISQYISEANRYKIRPTVSFGKADGYDYAIIDIFIADQKVIGILVK